MFTRRLIPFLFMFLVYLLSMGLYYNQTHSIIIDETEKKIEDILLSQRALSSLVSEIQKPEIYKLKNSGILHPGYFSSALLSSSYITIQLNKFANEEREKLGIAPLVYKYASPNPTNPENLADIYDMKIYEKFKNREVTKYKDIITEGDKQYLYYAISGKVIDATCLRCHGSPENAPQSLLDQYGQENGFGYKVGDLSSIISIKAPLNGIYAENDKQFLFTALSVFIIFIFFYVLAEILQVRLKRKEEEIKAALEKQTKSREKAKALESSIQNLYGHIISSKFDMQGKILEASDALIQLCGYSKEEVIGNAFCFFKHPDTHEDVLQEIWKTLIEGKSWNGEVKNLTKGGDVFWVELTINPKKDENNITRYFEAIMRTITQKKMLLEDINIDPLTSLLNRRSFEKSFLTEQNRAKRDKKIFSLIMIDIDFFKQYNDYYGHQEGDKALQSVALSLQESFRRSSDFVFRLGGEEFAVLSSETSVSQIVDSAQNARSNLHKKHIMHIKSDVNPFLTISIGLATVDYHSKLTLSDVYAKSDEALYKAKSKGRNRVEYVEL